MIIKKEMNSQLKKKVFVEEKEFFLFLINLLKLIFLCSESPLFEIFFFVYYTRK